MATYEVLYHVINKKSGKNIIPGYYRVFAKSKKHAAMIFHNRVKPVSNEKKHIINSINCIGIGIW